MIEEVIVLVPLTQEIGYLLSRASGLVIRATNEQLAEDGLRVRQYSVLSLVCEHAPGVSQRDLAEILGLDPSQVVLLVDELASAGLVRRQPSPGDRRTKHVVATASGRRCLRGAEKHVRAGQQSLLGRLAPEEQESLRYLLTRLISVAGE